MKKQAIKCLGCQHKAVKYGKRKNKHQIIQRYKCNSCNKIFTLYQTKHKTYPINIILNALSTYNLGYNLEKTSEKIEKKHKTKIPISTISSWINQYKKICTYARLRDQAIKQYKPNKIIQKQTLQHIQPYTFKYHKFKLNTILKENPKFVNLKNYLEKINSEKFPHHIFTYDKEFALNEKRASKIKFEHLKINQIRKQNLANNLTKLALNLALTNKQRHEAVQNFMLINDSTTIAIEIPIYLTNWDSGYYNNQKNFIFPLNNYTTPITGHIDLLQIRNNLIHILDYKPNANKVNAIPQPTIYALALSRKLNLRLYNFKAAWFDSRSYNEFFPLHVVYKLRKRKMEVR